MRNVLFSALLLALSSPSFAMSTAFTYQGSLEDAGLPANGTYDFQFELLDVQAIVREDVLVSNGVFTVDLDFGAAINDGNYELVIGVRPGASTGAFVVLGPTTPIRPAPQAQVAAIAGEAVSVSPNSIGAASIMDGSIGASEIDSSEVQRRIGTSCGAGEAIRAVGIDGTVTCAALGGGGANAVSSINTGSGLTGGPITTTGTISIANDGVTSSHISDGSVGVFDINVNEVQRRVVGNCPTGSAIRSIANDGSSACTSVAGFSWSLTGNAGTNPSSNFLGTTDNQPLVLRASNVQMMRLEARGNATGGVGNSTANVVAGSPSNSASAGTRGVTVMGGGGTPGSEGFTFFGEANVGYDNFTTVLGGVGNRAGSPDQLLGTGAYASVIGGHGNEATGSGSIILGGNNSDAIGMDAVVAGGELGYAVGARSTALGGYQNTTYGADSAALAGLENCAGGQSSFAGGSRAKVRPGNSATASGACSGVSTTNDANGDEGSFVWADASSNNAFVSTGANKFEVRAAGGVRLVSNASGTAGVSLAAGGGSWQTISDRNMKTEIESVDTSAVLAQVAALPIYTWRYQSQAEGIRHMGPMAQDFHATFKLNGDDDRSIATVDPDGVALAAIQGLNAKLEWENNELRARLSAIEAMLATLPKR